MDGDLILFVGFSLKCLEGGQGPAELNILCRCECQVDVLCVPEKTRLNKPSL